MFKMIYKNKFNKWPSLLFRLYSGQLIKSLPIYQPILRRGKLISNSNNNERNCLDRWQLISGQIKDNQVKSMADLGCAEGFYVLRTALEYKCASLGIDADIRRLAVAHNQLILNNIEFAGFLLAKINSSFVKKMPPFDMIICMSLMHHLMYQFGQDYCLELLKEIKKKINKVMIFEMGQSDETKNDWAKKLPDMGPNPHQWIADFLLSAGYRKVNKLGESDSYQKDQKRAIFKVIP